MILVLLQQAICVRKFPAFITKYNKKYDTDEAYNAALFNFCQHYNFSQANLHWHLKVNEYSDQPAPPISGMIRHAVTHKKVNYTDNIEQIDNNSISDINSTSSTANAVEGQQNASVTRKQSKHDDLSADQINTNTEAYFSDADVTGYNRDASIKSLLTSVCKRKVNSFDTIDTADSSFSIKQIYSGDKLPSAVDLRHDGIVQKPSDQGSCGSCYAFASRNTFHSLFMHDVYYYYNQSIFKDTLKNVDFTNLKFSVQFIMNYTYGDSNSFCAGGNYIAVANDMANSAIPSLQYENDYPYYSQFESDEAPPSSDPPKKPLKSDFSLKETISPIYLKYSTNNDDCPDSVYSVNMKTDEGKNIVKAALARGIVVAGQQQIPTNYDEQLKYSMWGDQVVSKNDFSDCSDQSNHQISIVGYGTYKNVSVWVIQNSWGASWGLKGTAYFKQGDNSLCTEEDASFQLPRYYKFNTELESLDQQYNQTLLFKIERKLGLNKDNYDTIRWGYSGLDREDGYVSKKLTKYAIISFSIIGVIAIILICQIGKCLMSAPPHNFKWPLYLRLDEETGQFVPWEKGFQSDNFGLRKKEVELEIADGQHAAI